MITLNTPPTKSASTINALSIPNAALLEIEQDILRAILCDPLALERVSFLEIAAFSVRNHRLVYEACLSLQKKGRPTDLNHVRLWLEESGKIPTGTPSWSLILRELAATYVMSINVDAHAATLQSAYINRFNKDLAAQFHRGEISKAQFDERYREVDAPEPSLSDKIEKILNKNLPKSKRNAELNELAKQYGYSTREIRDLAEQIQNEHELESEREENKREIEELLRLEAAPFEINKFLPPELAKPLTLLASWMGVTIEALLTILIPTAASLMNANSRVIGHLGCEFIEPLIIYAGICAESGSRKSPAIKAITGPLKKLQVIEDERYEAENSAYKAKSDEFKRLPKSEKENADIPEPPKAPREYYVIDATAEAINQIKGQQAGRSFAIIKDELSGLFGGYNKYRGGKGDDRESLLSAWNGEGIKINRAGGKRIFLSNDAASIIGGIQPDKLKEFMGDHRDVQGEWGRFLWCPMSVKAHPLPDTESRLDINEVLLKIYKKIDELPAIQFRLAHPTYQRFRQWHYYLSQQIESEHRQGMRAAIAKLQGYTLRLAGILHILWEVAQGQEPSEEIPTSRLNAAIDLVKFYWGQVKKIQGDAPSEGNITPTLKKILDMAKRGPLKPRDVVMAVRGQNKKRLTSSEVKDLFLELEKMGFGQCQKTSRSVEFVLGSVVNVATNVDNLSTLETLDTSTFELNVDKVDKNDAHLDFDSFLENNDDLDFILENPPETLSTLATLQLEDPPNPYPDVNPNVDTFNVDNVATTPTLATLAPEDPPNPYPDVNPNVDTLNVDDVATTPTLSSLQLEQVSRIREAIKISTNLWQYKILLEKSPSFSKSEKEQIWRNLSENEHNHLKALKASAPRKARPKPYSSDHPGYLIKGIEQGKLKLHTGNAFVLFSLDEIEFLM